jgi:transposase-like protein
VLEGLKGRPIGELCAEHEISQGQYDQWRGQFLANAAKAFEPAGAPAGAGLEVSPGARLPRTAVLLTSPRQIALIG